jgi:uncharacterized protein YeeX (DUF496 family)
MSLKDELLFPFGNPYKERLESHKTLTALNNVIKLAKDKMRLINGEGEELLLIPESADAINADMSIQEIERLIEYINGKEKTDTNRT